MTTRNFSVTCIGAGVIGSGWAARLLVNGINVTVFDKQTESYNRTNSSVERAKKCFSQLTKAPLRAIGNLTFAKSLEDALKLPNYIIESLPENLQIKQHLYKEIEEISNNSIILSSTSGFKPTDLQKYMKNPENLVVTHPFNPVYLMPLVEVVPGQAKDQSIIDDVQHLLEYIGMVPIIIKKEIDAFVADRMLEAMWREALWLIKDDICTTKDLDDIITSSFGIRFAQMGMFESYRIAGGDKGMRHFLDQFGPALKWPWSRLTDVPDFNSELIEKICSQSDVQSDMYSISELEDIRDKNLVELQKALRNNRWGSGRTLASYEKDLFDEQSKQAEKASAQISSDLLITYTKTIPPEWADYNGHMTEYRYLNCFGDASDAVMLYIGCNKAYIEAGNSYFTVETNIKHLTELKVGQEVYIETKVIKGTEKKLHVFHILKNKEGELFATGEHLLLHVSLKTRKTCPASEPLISKLVELQKHHQETSIPSEPKIIV